MTPHEPVKILLVDDQPGKLLSYEAILSPLGEELIKTGSAREALSELLRHDIAVVLVDVSMPEMDGFELAELIRHHPRYEKTAIIFVSAVHLSEMDRLKGYESGAVDYVSVPVVPQVLRAKVRIFAELYRKTLEAERLNLDLEERVAERTIELQTAIEKQVELSEQLKEADRRKDEFLALLAHELRNPLAPVRNAVEIMRLKNLEDPELGWCRDVIERQTNQLARLVDDLLDVSRITLGKIRLRLETICLQDVVSGAVETSRPIIDARRHRLTTTLPDAPVRVHGDLARLTQVVANLLNNAARYQAEGGRIALTVAKAGSEALISVGDTGVGLAPEHVPKLFQLFSQGERSADSAHGGLGIGLSLVKTLVELHGGTVKAFSAGLGQGSRFDVRLPVFEDAKAPGVVPVALGSGGAARRVLVVDDSLDSANSLATLLRFNGHEVFVAHDGETALGLSGSVRPNVVLLDIGLPGMDGYEICRRIRKLGLVDCLIIAMTGYGQARDRQRSSEAGFDEHTVKPVDIGELSRLISSVRT
ncbi:MAG TPA: response regulator [Gemmatimonadales bacterium]|nr:response regulator [Gemmatimonadales bacterium]